ncbi:hypothetical protein LT335_00580 [Spiroplasma sp. JKS002669]|uniref:hypothetical protein n=1 Tax=Spiroplasma attinicola TaxID=2904537 RepID=UPI002022D663|nr:MULTISPECIES: hypothetical protein [unclassified Spiroplasma]MCL6429019.1 hypothetical protein [Spiroplasma sp. JKS002669]MCL8209674.1 hypothetical protein [Spiroplasma sp. JKS002670]MCL8210489.1 hypothetical protein [Spiroplasma sp. JKS002671]
MNQSLQIGLSFIAGFVGALIGGLINLWIHYSSLKNIKIENQKNRKAQAIANDKIINAQLTTEVIKIMKDKNISREEIVNIINAAKPVVDLIINNLNLNQVKEAVNNNNKKLDDDIIKGNEDYDYAR